MASQSTLKEPYRIAIIGGGIGGLFAALSIHHHCHKDLDKIEIDVYEQAAEYKEIGAGVSLAVNASRLIEKIGLFDDCHAIAGSRKNVWLSFRRYDNSEDIHTAELDRFILEKQLPMHRAEFLEVLVQAIRKRGAATLHTNKRCQSLDVS
jgi:salicylate hydroxylase